VENTPGPPGRQAEMPGESRSLDTYYVVLRETSDTHLDNCITKANEKQILQKQKSMETYKEVEAG